MERGADGRVSREVCEKTADGWVKLRAHFDTLDDKMLYLIHMFGYKF